MTDDNATTRPAAKRQDRIVKWGFLAVALVAAGVVWWVQRTPPIWTAEWETDLAMALSKGKTLERPVLVVFHGESLNEETRKVARELLYKPESVALYKKHGYLRVHMGVGLSSQLAKDWGVTEFPTMVIVDSTGAKIRRSQGYMGLAAYWDFLDLAKSWAATRPASGPSQP